MFLLVYPTNQNCLILVVDLPTLKMRIICVNFLNIFISIFFRLKNKFFGNIYCNVWSNNGHSPLHTFGYEQTVFNVIQWLF